MAEKQKDNSKKQTKAIDVTQPGVSVPSASSRPVIVGHRPLVQDPMVTEDASSKSTTAAAEIKRTAPKVIAPINPELGSQEETELTDAQEASAVQPDVTQATDSEGEPEAPSGASMDKEIGSRLTADKPKDSKDGGSSIISAVANQVTKEKDKKLDKQQEELAKRQTEVEKLVEEKKYFVHTSQTVTRRKSTRWMAIACVFLILVGTYLILDAQVIKNDIKLPYEFFKEEKTAPGESADTRSNLFEGERNEAAEQDDKSTADQPNLEEESPAQIVMRDMQRKNELKNLQQKLETYFNDNGVYPGITSWTTDIQATTEEITGPRDDKYTYTTDSTTYTLAARLENKTDPDADSEGNFIIRSVNQ